MAQRHSSGRLRAGTRGSKDFFFFFERKDVNLNWADTKYGRVPLSRATNRGHEGIVKILIERKDDRTAMLDNANQTPQPVALSEAHDGARILLEWGNVNSHHPNRL